MRSATKHFERKDRQRYRRDRNDMHDGTKEMSTRSRVGRRKAVLGLCVGYEVLSVSDVHARHARTVVCAFRRFRNICSETTRSRLCSNMIFVISAFLLESSNTREAPD